MGNTAVGFGSSTISQQDAVLQANNQYITCVGAGVDPDPPRPPEPPQPPIDQPPTEPTEDGGGGGGGGSPPRQRQKVCNDDIAVCEVPCTAYGTFKYQIGKNQVCAFTQEDANRIADSLACQYALQNRFCLPPLSPIAWCVNNPYSAFIDSNAPPVTIDGVQFDATLEVDTGSLLPPGLGFNNASEFGGNKRAGLITGTPTEAGEFCFSLRATISNLYESKRRYCILIFDIDCPSGSAPAGQDYADLIELLGPINRVTNLTCGIIEGSLPPGLSLDPEACVISGHVPLDAAPGVYSFTVEACFTATIQGQSESLCCTKVCSITVGPATCPDWTDPLSFSWGAFTKEVHGGGTDATGTVNENQATINAYTGGGAAPDEFWVTANFNNDFVYNGPGCNARLRFNVLIAGQPPGAAGAFFNITRGVDVIVSTQQDGTVTGNYTYDFILDDTFGANVTYHFNFDVSVGNIGVGPPWEASNITALAKLEWQ